MWFTSNQLHNHSQCNVCMGVCALCKSTTTHNFINIICLPSDFRLRFIRLLKYVYVAPPFPWRHENLVIKLTLHQTKKKKRNFTCSRLTSKRTTTIIDILQLSHRQQAIYSNLNQIMKYWNTKRYLRGDNRNAVSIYLFIFFFSFWIVVQSIREIRKTWLAFLYVMYELTFKYRHVLKIQRGFIECFFCFFFNKFSNES